MSAIGSVTVYCSSSSYLDEAYHEAAHELGDVLARSGRTLVYGGGRLGLMGTLAKAWREAGGRVVGVITHRLRSAEQMDEENDENIVVSTMRERKALMEAKGDAFVILPGGLGTLEEFTEILVGRIVGEHDKPIAIVNTREPGAATGFYDPLLTLVEHMVTQRFAKAGVRELFEVVEDARGAVDALRHATVGEGTVRTDLMPGLPGGHDA